MTTRVFRLFLSSPGDVAVERRRAAAVVSRLNGECAGRARIDVIRWETEAYQAHSTFQAQIPLAVECDLVLALFKWRLGTELPPEFPERTPSGEPYPSGTAYELLTSIEARRRGAETPDVFVYRYGGSAPRPAIDDPERARIEQEWRRLEAFFARWFLTPEGHFRAAFQLYASEDDFEAQIEALLRRWLTDKVAAGRILAWPDAIKGPPYPGLESYGFRHAAVFFGRGREVPHAVGLWRERAAAGTPFLLVVGASGSGKSSLVKAGLLPRITTPGVIEGVDHWRMAVFRPADDPGGPLAALAAALVVSERDLPWSEEGRGPALPELAAEAQPVDLAGLLGSDPDAAGRRIVAALDRLGQAEQASERRGSAVRIDLALVVDQLDELFAPTLDDSRRDAFVTSLAALLETGRIWIAATLRADLYAAMLAHPGLKALKEAGASYDLSAPGAAELAEIVRRPAEAADLAFGADPATGEGVDERLLREADRPDMLPLVQLALARLYEGRRTEPGEDGRERTILPFDVYVGLGGLTGIVDEVGERTLAGLDDEACRALPRLVRSLAQLEQTGPLAGTLTLTPRPLAGIAPDEPSRRLVGALVAGRLLTVSDTGEGSLVRLAHQRILADWARAREIVQDSADFYRIRGEIEARRLRWEASRRADLLLPRGLPLAEAENVVARYGDEIASETRAYVRTSRIRAGRAMMLTGAAAVVFAVVAIVALFQWGVARERTALALRNFGVARDAIKGVVFDIVQGLGDVAGMRVDAMRRILSTAQSASDKLATTAPDDPELLRTRAAMFDNFSRMYAAVGDVPSARTSAARAVDILRGLLRTRPEDERVEGDLSVAVVTAGNAAFQAGDISDAKARFEEGLALGRIAARRAPGDGELRRRVLLPLSRLGEVRLTIGDYAGAVGCYQEYVEIARREIEAEPETPDRRLALSIGLGDLGFVGIESGDLDLARKAYGEAYQIARRLGEENPSNPRMQRQLSVALVNLGKLDLQDGHKPEALAKFDEALRIERGLLRDDPENAERRRTVAIGIENRSNGEAALENWQGALAGYLEMLEMFRGLVARNPFDLRNQRSITVALQLVGNAKRVLGDEAGARAASTERLDLARRLASQQSGNAEAQRDLAIALRDSAEMAELGGDREAGLALRREALSVARAIVALDRSNPQSLQLLQELLRALSQIQSRMGDQAGTLASFEEESEVLRRLLVLRPGVPNTRRLLGTARLYVGLLRSLRGEKEPSLTSFAEAVDIFRELLKEGSESDRRRLDISLDTLGRISLTFAETERAGAAFAELVALRREDLARSPSPQTRSALAAALVKLAQARSDPAPLLREAIELVDAVPEEQRSPDLRATRQEAETLLAGARSP